MYLYVYAYICVHTYMCMYAYIHICVQMYIHIFKTRWHMTVWHSSPCVSGLFLFDSFSLPPVSIFPIPHMCVYIYICQYTYMNTCVHSLVYILQMYVNKCT
jgi:hypothetical protein